MKILVVGDIHFSQYSSILRKRGNKYSIRLENLIDSINWAEDLAIQLKADKIVYLGDFFDKPELVSEEITALTEIKWSTIDHVFLCGNHEIASRDLAFNSANTFLLTNMKVINDVEKEEFREFELCYLPYIFEEDRKDIHFYLGDKNKKRIIFSHNDIKDFQMGSFISTEGFSIEDIQNNCDIYLNGHLHNGGKVEDKIINVGNITGQNFSEDGFKYTHSVVLLDTEDMSCAVYDNPYAFNFYKIDFTGKNDDIDYINKIGFMIRNAIITIRCYEDNYSYLNKRFNPSTLKDNLIPRQCNVVECRFIIQQKNKEISKEDSMEDISIDHIEKFKSYILEKFGETDIVKLEINEVCK